MEGAGGGLFPLNEAPRHWKQHPPIVAGLEMGGNGMGTGCGQAGGGGGGGGGAARGPRCQTGSSCTREGRQVLWGEGWIKQINT